LRDRKRFRVPGERCGLQRGVALVDRPERRLGGAGIFLELAYLGPAERAAIAAQPREEHEVGERERDGEIEEPRPPAGHRIVVLGEIPVPDVARRPALGGLAHALHLQQHRAADDRNQADRADVDIPEAAREEAHGWFLPSCSSSNGSRAARSKRSLRPGLYAHHTTPTNAASATAVIRLLSKLISIIASA